MNESEILIELMSESDVAQLAFISYECFSECWSEFSFLSEFKNKNAVTFVAHNEENIAVGFVNAHCILDECYLNNIAVLSDFQHKKIGQALLDELTQYALKHDVLTITLEVRKSNSNAIAFYNKNRFKQVGMRKEFYQNPIEDALLLTKIINTQ